MPAQVSAASAAGCEFATDGQNLAWYPEQCDTTVVVAVLRVPFSFRVGATTPMNGIRLPMGNGFTSSFEQLGMDCANTSCLSSSQRYHRFIDLGEGGWGFISGWLRIYYLQAIGLEVSAWRVSRVQLLQVLGPSSPLSIYV